MEDLKLVQTCGACPEQYDVYLEDSIIGYMRLRHGRFYAECHDVLVYSASPRGDGMFKDDERTKYLNEAVSAIKKALKNEKTEPDGWYYG